MPPFWAMYVGVPKLEDAAAHIKKLGGREYSPVIDIPTVGRMQMMADPQGAAFYIYEPDPSDAATPEGAPDIGEASWHELMTTDAPAAMKFYTDAVRLAAERDDGHGSRWASTTCSTVRTA